MWQSTEKEAGTQVSMEKNLNRKLEHFGLRKWNDFPSRNGGKGKVKDMRDYKHRKSEGIYIGSRMTFPAATAEKERLKTHVTRSIGIRKVFTSEAE